MTNVNISACAPVGVKNNGDRREWAVCAHMGVERTKHDAGAYDRDSDVNVGALHISVKSSAFTLMSGNLCEGLADFDSIWKLYKSRTHSNTFAYVDDNMTMTLMDINEFEKFVYTFCRLERESEKNGGAWKIRCRKESQKMRDWLSANAA